MNKLYGLLSRYILILLVGLGNLFIFYKIFYPLTFYPVSFILSFLGSVNKFYALNLILFNTTAIDLVGACVAGAAYYLIFILIMSTANLSVVKKIKLLFVSYLAFLIFNIIRIVLMTLIAGASYFEPVHMLFWYFISVIFVVIIWFSMVKLFRIKDIPVYSDFKFLMTKLKAKKK